MTSTASTAYLSRLSEFVAAHMGLHFPPARWADLHRGVSSAAPEFGFDDVESCIRWLVSSPLTEHQVEILASHLTIGETYFFREKKSLEAIETHILPELIRSRRRERGGGRQLRIWSAGCCTGEEPYSLAIMLSKMLPDRRDWRITILATDINPRFLRKAAAGVYGAWSFRETPPQIKESYFRPVGEGRFEVVPQIKDMVSFSRLNLVEDAYPSLSNNTNDLDVILCRNVLMYLVEDQRRKVLHQFHRGLTEGGWLVVSPSETPLASFSEFTAVNFPDAILYRKVSGEASASRTAAETTLSLPTKYAKPPEPAVERAVEQRVVPPMEQSNAAAPTRRRDPGRAATPETESVVANRAGEVYREAYGRALALFEQGRYSEAAAALAALLSDAAASRGAEARAPEAKAMALLAHAYANGGHLAEALMWCEKAIAADKLRASSHYLRATILQEQGQLNEAITSLRRAIYLDPDFVMAHFALGNLARRQGKMKEAEKHFANALHLARGYDQVAVLPAAEGITAGRLSGIIEDMSRREALP
jgi:chemotaxis protein methyltransferase CheR